MSGSFAGDSMSEPRLEKLVKVFLTDFDSYLIHCDFVHILSSLTMIFDIAVSCVLEKGYDCDSASDWAHMMYSHVMEKCSNISPRLKELVLRFYTYISLMRLEVLGGNLDSATTYLAAAYRVLKDIVKEFAGGF